MPADDESGESSAPSPPARARRMAGRGGSGPKPGPRRGGAPQPGVTFGDSDGPAPTAAEPEKKSRAGRDLPAAIGVGVGLGLLIIASLFLYRPSFAYLVGAAVVYGCFELSRALTAAQIRVALGPVVVG